MELKILNEVIDERITEPHYKLNIHFMEGDADGSQEDEIIFFEKDLEEYKKFIVALEGMNRAYPHGRGGYDEYDGVIEHEIYFNEEYNFADYYEELGVSEYEVKDLNEDELWDFDQKIYNRLNPLDIYVRIPSDCNYITCSFRGYELTYINEDGTEFEVEVSFTEEEEKRFQEIVKVLN